MAKWGRKHYGITEQDDRKAIRQLAAILMGKQDAGAFRPVKLAANKKLKSAPVTVELPENFISKRSFRPKAKADGFYDSWEWKTLRYKVLKKHGAKCMFVRQDSGRWRENMRRSYQAEGPVSRV